MQKVIVGNHAVSWGVKLARTEVIPAYPITPQTQIVEELSEMCASGELPARFIKVESEHSAMASAVGASAAGARAFTATSSQGLALMHEMLHWAAAARHPIVMADVNRALGPGWNIWNRARSRRYRSRRARAGRWTRRLRRPSVRAREG